MKKSILFVIPSLGAGGGEKSLVNLLNQIDYNLYDIDLVMFNKSGVFINALPKAVNILDLNLEYNNFIDRIDKSILSLFLRGRLDLIYSRIMFTLKNRIIRNTSKAEQYTWKYVSKSIETLPKKYDVAIGYLEKSSIYFVVDKVNSDKKIGFIHNDYDKLGMDYNIDINYFDKLDNIVTVSEICEKVLKNRFPMYKNKISIIQNIVSPKTIKKLSLDDIDIIKRKINLVSVGRLNYQKGFDIAIEAFKMLIEDGYDIVWNIIGEGEERTNLEQKIQNYNLKSRFNLIGIKENPYPYIREANIYIQPSRFEGKAIAIDEAKILAKPIIVTNFSTSKDQIQNEKTGLIVELNKYDLYKGIKRLIEDKNLQQILTTNLLNEKLGTEEEINKLYKLIND